MLHRRYITGLPQVALCGSHCGNIWVSESLWVREVFFTSLPPLTLLRLCRDFFPVILTFLRQLPFVGSLLQLPYIRDVCSPPHVYAERVLNVRQVADRIAGSRVSVV